MGPMTDIVREGSRAKNRGVVGDLRCFRITTYDNIIYNIILHSLTHVELGKLNSGIQPDNYQEN